MKLSEFKNEKKETKPEPTISQKDITDQYNELKDASQQELFEKLSQEVLSQKKNGTFDYKALVSAIEKMKDFLPEQTYKNMLQVLENLK